MADLTDSLIAVVLFALLLPLLVLPWSHHQYARYGHLRGWSAFLAATETLYLCGLIAFTLFPLPQHMPAGCTGTHLNLNPLNDLAATSNAVTQIALNVVLFVPLGFLLRYRFQRGFAQTAAIGFGVSLVIETVQGTAVLGLFPCPYRVADVGDLITNSTGAVLGGLLAAAAAGLLPDPEPTPAPDVARPGLLRRGLAVGADLLIGYLGSASVLAVLLLAGVDDPLSGAVIQIGVLAVTTLVVPLCRRDRATPGQAAFFLAPARERAAAAVPALVVAGQPAPGHRPRPGDRGRRRGHRRPGPLAPGPAQRPGTADQYGDAHPDGALGLMIAQSCGGSPGWPGRPRPDGYRAWSSPARRHGRYCTGDHERRLFPAAPTEAAEPQLGPHRGRRAFRRLLPGQRGPDASGEAR